MVVASLVETARSERLKKHLCIPGEDEYQCSSGPLNDFVLLSVLQSMPSQAGLSKRRSRPLKPGYVADLVREGGVSPCCLILGLIYIQRLAARNPAYMTTLSPRKLFLIAMVVASKYLNDEGEMEALTNSEWATLGAVPKSNLDILERNFLSAMDWKLYVPLDEFYSFVNSVEGSVAIQQAMKRGWLSYTDLISIWNSSEDYTSMLQHTTKVAFTGATLYLMCVSTLLAAAHSFCSESATSTGPPSLPSSLSAASLPGFPLDSSPSPIWTSNSTTPAISTSAKMSIDSNDVFRSPKLLLGPTQLPEPSMLTRWLLWSDPGIASDSTCCSSMAAISKFHGSLANLLQITYGALKPDPGKRLEKLASCGMSTKNYEHGITSRVHSSRQPSGSSGDIKHKYPHSAYTSLNHIVEEAKVKVPQALELEYNSKGTFHWDPLLNASSMLEEAKIGTFGVLFQYFLDS